MARPAVFRSTGALRGARFISLPALALAAGALLAGCETGPQMIENSVAGCVEHLTRMPMEYRAPLCRCLGSEMEKRFTYQEIRQYRLATDNWTYFVPVAGDHKFMFVPRLCLSRHVPEEYR